MSEHGRITSIIIILQTSDDANKLDLNSLTPTVKPKCH